MRLRIQRNQIHHWVDVPVLDDSGNPTGETKEVLEFGINSPDYPHLPTYGIRVDYPISESKIKAEVLALIDEVEAQMQRDEVIRQQFEDMGYLEFDSNDLLE